MGRKIIDMSNKIIKNWKVLSLVEENISTNKSKRWKCKCIQCGAIKIFDGSELRLNRVGACKHKTKEKDKSFFDSRIKNEIGNRYGKLLVVDFAYTKKGLAYWKCMCDCGKECIARGNSLRQKRIKSCGCLRSYQEEEIKRILENNNISYKREFSFVDLKDKNYLRFDFAIFKNDKLLGLIEYNGIQHYESNNTFNHYGLLQKHDDMKRQYCKNKQIPLLILNKESLLENLILNWYISLV